jgi:hypothetical protein
VDLADRLAVCNHTFVVLKIKEKGAGIRVREVDLRAAPKISRRSYTSWG